MRDADRKSGRTGIHIRPRFGIWENVVGALSSGRDAETGQKKPGADFQKVLEAFLQVEEPYLHAVRPEAGRWEYAGGILGVRSSVAWIVWDAQHFECPKDAVECSLWQILQATAPSRYSLSQTACLVSCAAQSAAANRCHPYWKQLCVCRQGLTRPRPYPAKRKLIISTNAAKALTWTVCPAL